MSMAEPLTVLKSELMQTIVPQLMDFLTTARQEGRRYIRWRRPLGSVVACRSPKHAGVFASHGPAIWVRR